MNTLIESFCVGARQARNASSGGVVASVVVVLLLHVSCVCGIGLIWAIYSGRTNHIRPVIGMQCDVHLGRCAKCQLYSALGSWERLR